MVDRPGDRISDPRTAGVLRYYVRVSGEIVWADQPENLMQHRRRRRPFPPGVDPRADQRHVHPASVFDNPALLQVTPNISLAAVAAAARERAAAGRQLEVGRPPLYFKRNVLR